MNKRKSGQRESRRVDLGGFSGFGERPQAAPPCREERVQRAVQPPSTEPPRKVVVRAGSFIIVGGVCFLLGFLLFGGVLVYDALVLQRGKPLGDWFWGNGIWGLVMVLIVGSFALFCLLDWKNYRVVVDAGSITHTSTLGKTRRYRMDDITSVRIRNWQMPETMLISIAGVRKPLQIHSYRSGYWNSLLPRMRALPAYEQPQIPTRLELPPQLIRAILRRPRKTVRELRRRGRFQPIVFARAGGALCFLLVLIATIWMFLSAVLLFRLVIPPEMTPAALQWLRPAAADGSQSDMSLLFAFSLLTPYFLYELLHCKNLRVVVIGDSVFHKSWWGKRSVFHLADIYRVEHRRRLRNSTELRLYRRGVKPIKLRSELREYKQMVALMKSLPAYSHRPPGDRH